MGDTMLDYGAIGKRIRFYRKKKMLSQEALAEMVWISTTHMSHIETGSTKLSLPVLADLSKALGVSSDEILFGESEQADDFNRSEMEKAILACCDEHLDALCQLIKVFSKTS